MVCPAHADETFYRSYYTNMHWLSHGLIVRYEHWHAYFVPTAQPVSVCFLYRNKKSVSWIAVQVPIPNQ
jgi:hypothetical protein